jgi:hypothetical protein
VIVYNVKDSRLRTIRKYLLGIPILCGSILGFSSIPFISNGAFGCHLTTRYPLLPVEVLQQLGYQDSNWPFVSFLLVPTFLALFYSTFITSFILFKMWRVDKRSQKWSMSQWTSILSVTPKRKVKPRATALTTLRREVFQQCFQYLAAAFMTWFLYLLVTAKTETFIASHYELWLRVFFLGGIQGFLNCMIYFQPRMIRSWRHWRRMRQDRQYNKRNRKINSESLGMEQENQVHTANMWTEIAQVEPAVDIIQAFDDEDTEIMSQKHFEDNKNQIGQKPSQETLELKISRHEPKAAFNDCGSSTAGLTMDEKLNVMDVNDGRSIPTPPS